ncbi:MAG TPA: glycosyltransferase [Pirellulales bacterium]|nr:glycosyltransferase [Pirellulales bacterium]
MRLLVVTNLFWPDRGGGASVFSDLCFGLAERGHDVTVFTTHPYYPEWRRKSDDSPWRVRRETIRGVDVRRYGLFVPARPQSLVARLQLEASFFASLLRSLVPPRRFDAVMAFCPLVSAVAYAGVRRTLLREPLWLNIQDIPADAFASTGMSKSRRFDQFASAIQSLLFGRGDMASSISPTMVERVRTIIRPSTPIALFPNWLNDTLAAEVQALPAKANRPVRKAPVLLYAGNIGAKQGLRELCEKLHSLDLAFEFRVHGDGGEAANVRAFIEQSGDARFRFGPFLDEAGFARALHEADLFVITEKPGIGASFIPSKLIPCIATGTPIFAVCDRLSPLGREMAEGQLGLNIPWEDQESLAGQLHAFVSDEPAFHHCQQNCLERARIYTRAAALDRAEALLAELVAARGPARTDNVTAVPSQQRDAAYTR